MLSPNNVSFSLSYCVFFLSFLCVNIYILGRLPKSIKAHLGAYVDHNYHNVDVFIPQLVMQIWKTLVM